MRRTGGGGGAREAVSNGTLDFFSTRKFWNPAGRSFVVFGGDELFGCFFFAAPRNRSAQNVLVGASLGSFAGKYLRDDS